MLYTGKGDKGTTTLFTTPKGERLPKTHEVFEALGTIDELNAYLGVVKVTAGGVSELVDRQSCADIIHHIQQQLFIIQAELAGAPMKVAEVEVVHAGEMVGMIEALLPPITTFFISGGTRFAAECDTARAIARRAERAVLRAIEKEIIVSAESCAYLNRLSSVLYALARFGHHVAGISEDAPTYNRTEESA